MAQHKLIEHQGDYTRIYTSMKSRTASALLRMSSDSLPLPKLQFGPISPIYRYNHQCPGKDEEVEEGKCLKNLHRVFHQ